MFFNIILSLFVGSATQAATLGIFNDEKVVVVVQGNDTDAKRLFDALTVQAIEDNNKMTKKYEMTSGAGETIFSVLCSLSQLANSASCTLTFNRWYAPVSVITENTEPKYVLLESANTYQNENILKNFTPSSQPSDMIYSSENNLLRIWAFKDHLGKATKFAIQYDEN